MKNIFYIVIFSMAILLSGCANRVDEQTVSAIEPQPFIIAPYEVLETTDRNISINRILKEDYINRFDSLQSSRWMEREKTYWLRIDLSKIIDKSYDEWIIRTGVYAISNIYINRNDSIAVSKSGRYDPIRFQFETINWRYHSISHYNLINGRFIYVELSENYFKAPLLLNQVQVLPKKDFEIQSVVFFIEGAEYNFRAVLFLGGIAFLLIYTFGIYFVYKDRLYLLYGAYLVFLLMYLGVKMYPLQSTLLFGGFPILNHMWNEVTQIMLNFWYTRFVRKFIDAEELYPLFNKWARIIEKVLLGFVVVVILNIAIDPFSEWLYFIVTAERLMMIVFALSFNIYILINLKDRRALFIMAGSATLLSGSVTALILGDIQYFMIGVMIEIFIFAMGLGLLMKRREDQRSELSKEMEKVKMRALQTQMNPHFIFNSLNSIRSYMIKNETKEASGYLSKFSRLIRQILEYSSEEYITLKQELQVLALYVQIEQLRFRDEFGFSIEADETIEQEELMVPPLIVQPFLENAIWHGLMQKEGEKKIDLLVKDKGKSLEIIVRDNGIGREESNRNKMGAPKETKSMAIDLTTQRLEMLEADIDLNVNKKVTIIDLYKNDRSPAGTEVRLLIPKKQRVHS